MSDVELQNVRKIYGEYVAVDGVDLRVQAGEFVTLLGPSGCGKTTCLRMLAGFVRPTAGRILMGGRDVTTTAPHQRNTGMVFQSYALFPHKSVADNIAFGLTVRRVSRAERDERTRDALRLIRLEALADRFPAQLSGGQRQRVALARAIVIRPEILLLDEPLGALDLKLREELQIEIKRIQSQLNVTTLFVTHDQGEALSMSTRIAVMREGKIVQLGSPGEIYRHPNSRYTASFVGKVNLIPVVVSAKDIKGTYKATLLSNIDPTQAVEFIVRGAGSNTFSVGDKCLLAVRPENLHFAGESDENKIAMNVTSAAYMGSSWQVEGNAGVSTPLTVVAHSGMSVPASGEVAIASWGHDQCFLLPQD